MTLFELTKEQKQAIEYAEREADIYQLSVDYLLEDDLSRAKLWLLVWMEYVEEKE